MPRTVPEWSSDNPDAMPPQRVRVRVFERCGGLCHRCGRKIGPADKWTLEHLIAICNGGANAEGNMGLTCSWCLPDKNREDIAEKSAVYRKRSKHIGVKKAKYKWPKRGFGRSPSNVKQLDQL